MSGSAIDSAPSTAMGRFADGLLAADLPGLADERRHQTVAFVERRADGLPSFTRFGVRVIALKVHLLGRLLGHERVRAAVLRFPLPLVSEYPRLVRSLGYAYVWETWPDTRVDGSAGVPAVVEAVG